VLRRCVWSRNIKNGCSIYIYDISRLRVNLLRRKYADLPSHSCPIYATILHFWTLSNQLRRRLPKRITQGRKRIVTENIHFLQNSRRWAISINHLATRDWISVYNIYFKANCKCGHQMKIEFFWDVMLRRLANNVSENGNILSQL